MPVASCPAPRTPRVLSTREVTSSHTQPAGTFADMVEHEQQQQTKSRASMSVGVVLAALMLLAFVILAVQNTNQVSVHWLVLDGEQPLWLVLAITGIAGVIVAKLASFAWNHRD